MKNYLSFQAIDSRALEAARIDSGAIDPQVRQAIINDKMMKLYRALDGANDPFYNRTALLTVTTDHAFSNGDTGGSPGTVTINFATGIVTDTAHPFTAGELLFVALFDALGLIWNQSVLLVVNSGTAVPFILISGASQSLTPGALNYAITRIRSLSTLTVDLSAYYFKSIRRVWDTGVTGKPRIFDEYTDSVAFQRLSENYFERFRTAYYQSGDSLYLFRGENAAPINQLQMEYRGKPALYTEATMGNMVDIPPEDNQVLIDEVTAEFLTKTEQAIPEKLAGTLDSYQKLYGAQEAK